MASYFLFPESALFFPLLAIFLPRKGSHNGRSDAKKLMVISLLTVGSGGGKRGGHKGK